MSKTNKNRKSHTMKLKQTRKQKRNPLTNTKKTFLYNPSDPSKSFDVYIDKNPEDTISIKYTTPEDVSDTIRKLEYLYKTRAYSHKRLWQVGMIMKVRLEAIYKRRTTKYKNAKHVSKRYSMAKKYFEYLSNRTKMNEYDRRRSRFIV